MKLTVLKAFHSLLERDQFEIKSKSHKINRVEKRQAFVLIMRDLGFSSPVIGQVINKTHCTVLSLEKRGINEVISKHIDRYLNAIHRSNEMEFYLNG